MQNRIDVEALRIRLQAEITEVERALAQASEAAAIVELDQARAGRLARMDALQQQAMGSNLAERLRLQKRRLAAALERLREDTYGVCCQCHEPIAAERLEADLAAPFCAECQHKIDERRGNA